MCRRIPIIFLIIFVCMIFSAHADDGSIQIGVSIGLTGKYEKMADMQKKAYLLWEEKTNAQGGLLGKTVEMIIKDDQSDKTTAKRIYEQFIIRDKLDFVIGPYSSGITGAILPVAEENGYPVLVAGASSDTLWSKGYRYVFGVYIPASRYAVGFLEMIAMNGITDIAIVHADDSFSSTIAAGARKWGKEFGLNVIFIEAIKKGTHDLAALAGRIKKENPKALLVCGHFDESVDMIESLNKINWLPDNYFATVGPTLPAYYQKLQESANLSFSTSQWEPGVIYKSGDKKMFLEPFIEKYKMKPSYHAATAFAACQILATAIQKTSSVDRDRIRDVLSTMDTMSIIGRYGVDKSGMQIKHFPITIQWQQGEKTIVWPEVIAKAEPIISQ
jgi:branched-chain amino acid transport system substrate-binding protein